ncbi:MAG: hypothetical protein LBR70_06815 [Lactobacillaceae bacterium]|jgi:hypothetical protein|nr:hypothetical protein [Lactobacillaceae bacterium]
MKKLLAIGLLFFISACSHCNGCGCQETKSAQTYHKPAYNECGNVTRVNAYNRTAESRCGNSCGCAEQVPCQDRVVREPINKTVYQTVYNPGTYSKEACERLPYKTADCTAKVYEDEAPKRTGAPIVYYEQKTYNVKNECGPCCNKPKSMTCTYSYE